MHGRATLVGQDEPNEVCDKFYNLTVKAIDEFYKYSVYTIKMNPFSYRVPRHGVYKTIELKGLRYLNVNISNPKELRGFVCKVVCKFTQYIAAPYDTSFLRKLKKTKTKRCHKYAICFNMENDYANIVMHRCCNKQ